MLGAKVNSEMGNRGANPVSSLGDNWSNCTKICNLANLGV